MAAQPPPRQRQEQPGVQHEMEPSPKAVREGYKPSEKLKDKVALITGGDSGIGRSVAVYFALEGARVAFTYVSPKEDSDAAKTVELLRGACKEHEPLKIPCDFSSGDERDCKEVVQKVVDHFGKLDVLVNNAAEQHEHASIEEVTAEEWDRTMKINLYAYFYLAKAAVPHMKAGSCMINTTSVNAYKGNPSLLAYSITKGGIVALVRCLALSLADKGIRVNGVAPGPIWTPLIPATFTEEKVESFGTKTPMQRMGFPEEVGPSYVFLASDDSTYFSGQVLHPNGGVVVNA